MAPPQPSSRLADAPAQHVAAATCMYEFAWCSPQFDGRLGACHALELPFIFDTPGIRGIRGIRGKRSEALLGPTPPQPLADSMHAAWVAVATSGGPGWPRYDLARRATMRFDTTSTVVDDPLTRERALWEGAR